MSGTQKELGRCTASLIITVLAVLAVLITDHRHHHHAPRTFYRLPGTLEEVSSAGG